ncbi:hypothetical protein LXA43DRAFT_718491 [Ganoderma leucocontextum]|nr:hypothetical protein LXA43DRAFT_718491 [Ganoderma leucocontextum]
MCSLQPQLKLRRIWFVSRSSRFLTSVLSFIVFSRFAVGLVGASSVLAFSSWSTSRIRDWLLPIVTLSLSLGAFTDISIVIIFSFYMLRGRSQYARVSKTLMNLLMLYAINTGAATAATSLSVVIVYASVHITLASTGLAEIGAKLYANSFIGRTSIEPTAASGRVSAMSNSQLFLPRILAPQPPCPGRQ